MRIRWKKYYSPHSYVPMKDFVGKRVTFICRLFRLKNVPFNPYWVLDIHFRINRKLLLLPTFYRELIIEF